MPANHVWREGPCNESNNKAHEPTSDRSTHCGSGHLIQVFHDIGRIFSSLYPSLAVLFLSRSAPVRDLLLCAKDLFVAAMVWVLGHACLSRMRCRGIAATPAALRAMACADGWHVRAGRRTHVPTFFLFWRHGCLAAAKFACLQRQKPAMFAQTPLFVYRHFTGAVCTT